jgi:hypothetical protein
MPFIVEEKKIEQKSLKKEFPKKKAARPADLTLPLYGTYQMPARLLFRLAFFPTIRSYCIGKKGRHRHIAEAENRKL